MTPIPQNLPLSDDTPPTPEEWAAYIEAQTHVTVDELKACLSPDAIDLFVVWGLTSAQLDPLDVHILFATILGHILFDAEMKSPGITLEQRLELFCVNVRTSYALAQSATKANNPYHGKDQVF